MAGYNASMNVAKASYASGKLVITRENGIIEFGGDTYPCKRIIREFGSRDGGARWNNERKVWMIAESDMYEQDWLKLNEIMGGRNNG